MAKGPKIVYLRLAGAQRKASQGKCYFVRVFTGQYESAILMRSEAVFQPMRINRLESPRRMEEYISQVKGFFQ